LVLPLEQYANPNRTGEQYSEFFRVTVNSLLDTHPPLEICGIICDNLPPQVAGLRTFLDSRAEDIPRIMHIPSMNHIINLVFTEAIPTDPFANVATQFHQVIHAVKSSPGIELVGRRCPAPIRTPWVCLADIIGFIPNHHNDAQTALQVVRDLLIPSEFAQIYLLLLSPSLFSHALEEH
jgi:hypothetical protein